MDRATYTKDKAVMKYVFVTAFIFLHILFTYPIKNAFGIEKNRQVINEIEKKIEESKAFTLFLKNKTNKEKTNLNKRLQTLKQRIEELELEIANKEKKFEGLKSKERLIREALNNENKQIQEIQASIHGFSSDILEIFHNNPVSLQLDDLAKIEQELTDESYNFNFRDFQNLMETLFAAMEKSGNVEIFTTEVANTSGKFQKYKALRIGTFNLYVLNEKGKVKVAKVSPDNKAIISSVNLPWFKSRRVKKYLENKSEVVPMDVSGNLAYMNTDKKGIRGWFQAGGVIMWPLLAVALAAVGISLERWNHLRKLVYLDDSHWKSIISSLQEENYGKCVRICETNQRNPLCKVLYRVFSSDSAENAYRALNEEVLLEIQNMEKFLPTLAMIAAVAPLLGLLGTVSGIIETFQTIAVVGAGNPRYLSSGISEALITTQFGLMIAIPVIIVHHILEKWVDGHVFELEEKVHEITKYFSGESQEAEPCRQQLK